MDNKRGKWGMNWKIGNGIFTLKEITNKNLLIAQGNLLWRPKWEGNLTKREYTYMNGLPR